MAGFKLEKHLSGSTSPSLIKKTLKNSGTFTIGDSVRLSSGFVDLTGAGNAVYGHILSIVDKDGLPVTSNGAGGNFTDTYTTASDNQTVAQVAALIDVSPETVYAVIMDDTLGTTTGSDLAGGYNVDLVAASDQLDESTTTTGSAQYAIVGQSRSGTSREVYVKIHERQL